MSHISESTPGRHGTAPRLVNPTLDPDRHAGPEAIRLFVYRSSRLLFDALSASLGPKKGLRVLGSTATQPVLLDRLQQGDIDVLLIESDGHVRKTLGLMRRVMVHDGLRSVLVLSTEPSDETIVRFIEAGASACVSRSSSLTELVDAIHLVHEGKSPCSPRVTALVCRRLHELAMDLRLRQGGRGCELTARESEILGLIAKGLVNKEIARRAGIRVQTVKSHVHNLFKKLGAESRRDAVIKAIEHGLIDEAMLGSS